MYVNYCDVIHYYDIIHPCDYCHYCRPVDADGVVIEKPHAVRTNVTKLHVRGKSPTVYEFNLTVTDQHNLTSWDSVLVTVTKGILCLP